MATEPRTPTFPLVDPDLPPVDRRYGTRGEPDWRAIDWTQHQSWARILGRWMNVVELGPTDRPEPVGEPVVLIHGHQGRWAHWLENLPALARHHRVITPDLPGFGDSEMPAGELAISGYAEAVAGLLEQRGVRRAAVVGHSMGGFVAAELAITRPDLVERLVLVSAAGLSDRYVGVPTAVITHPSGTNVARVLLAERGLPEGLRRSVSARPRARVAAVGFAMLRPDRISSELIYEYVKGAGRPGAAPAALALAAYDFSDRVTEIACPTLVVWGRQDRMVPFACLQRYHEAIPHSEIEVFERTGHCPPAERPLRFNAVVEAFLDRPGGRSARATGA
jgi:pimeloyl-ACP methyl ester carboxylesterase